MIAHNGLGTYVYGKYLAQVFEFVNNPLFSVFVAFARIVIIATQKRPAYASCDAVVVRCGSYINLGLSSFGHSLIPLLYQFCCFFRQPCRLVILITYASF